MEANMPDPHISVPADLREALDKKLGRGASQAIAQAAFVEWASWLLASSRPVSISEIESERVHTLYSSILKDELPSASRLSALLQLPIARCRYIVQSLSYQYPQLFEQRRLAVLKQAFDSVTKQGDVYVMDIDPGCRDVLDATLGSIADSAGLAELRGRRHGGSVRYELTSGYYQRLGKELDDQIAALKGA
jgi:hypothetical protein